MGKKLRVLTTKKQKDLEVLKNKSEEIAKEEIKTKKFQDFLDNLIYTAKNHTLQEGWVTAGLAGVQVGKPIRVFVALKPDSEEYEIYINPEIEYLGKTQEKALEGCLSLPEEQKEIPRHRKIRVKYWNREGKRKKEKYTEFTARVIQHECDHLEGILFTEKALP